MTSNQQSEAIERLEFAVRMHGNDTRSIAVSVNDLRELLALAKASPRQDDPMTNEELMPCPFCGCKEPQLMEGHRNHWRVECPRCGVRRAQFANGGAEEDKARAIRSWNTRLNTDDAVDELRERLRSLHNALTPSAETKAAYIGEFSFIREGMGADDNYVAERIDVPWTTIKEIMAAILGRAALSAMGKKS